MDEANPVRVLRVRKGAVSAPQADRAERIFSVVLSGPTADLSIVAGAVDPVSGLAIPRAGEPHPKRTDLLARPPWIMPVGFRDRGGAVLAEQSAFFNVRVPYVKAAT